MCKHFTRWWFNATVYSIPCLHAETYQLPPHTLIDSLIYILNIKSTIVKERSQGSTHVFSQSCDRIVLFNRNHNFSGVSFSCSEYKSTHKQSSQPHQHLFTCLPSSVAERNAFFPTSSHDGSCLSSATTKSKMGALNQPSLQLVSRWTHSNHPSLSSWHINCAWWNCIVA